MTRFGLVNLLTLDSCSIPTSIQVDDTPAASSALTGADDDEGEDGMDMMGDDGDGGRGGSGTVRLCACNAGIVERCVFLVVFVVFVVWIYERHQIVSLLCRLFVYESHQMKSLTHLYTHIHTIG